MVVMHHKALMRIFEKLADLLCCLFSTIFLSLFSPFILFSFFPKNICRGVQNEIRKICNEKQVFILPFLPLPHFSAQRQLF